MPGVGIKVAITGDATGLKGALNDAERRHRQARRRDERHCRCWRSRRGGGGPWRGAIGDMTKAAAEDRAEQEKLNAIYVAAGAATRRLHRRRSRRAIDAGAEKAFSDSEVRAGLQSLVVATGDAAKANALLGPCDGHRAAGGRGPGDGEQGTREGARRKRRRAAQADPGTGEGRHGRRHDRRCDRAGDGAGRPLRQVLRGDGQAVIRCVRGDRRDDRRCVPPDHGRDRARADPDPRSSWAS